MACPYFLPTKRLAWPHWRGKLRPPLGEVYAGECTACEGGKFQPPENLLEKCNLGYAAGECSRFPESEGPDAVRFAVSSDRDDVVRITYSYEQGHLPCGHGVIEYCSRQSRWSGVEGGSLLHRQVQAYLASYLRSLEDRSEHLAQLEWSRPLEGSRSKRGAEPL